LVILSIAAPALSFADDHAANPSADGSVIAQGDAKQPTPPAAHPAPTPAPAATPAPAPTPAPPPAPPTPADAPVTPPNATEPTEPDEEPPAAMDEEPKVDEPEGESSTEGQVEGGGDDNMTALEDDEKPHKKKHKKKNVEYKPGSGFYLRDGKAQLRLRFIVEPVTRFSYLSCGPNVMPCLDPQIDFTIRRGRAGFKVKLPHDLGLDVEVQVKNLHFGITHFYGTYNFSKDQQLEVGFIKPPGNIERKVNIWETPWIERGVVSTWVSIARVMGVMLTGANRDRTVWYQAAISKAVPRGLDGAESEDLPPPRPGSIDPDDAIKGAGQVNVDGRIEWDPSKDYEVGAFGGVRFRDDGDPGDVIAEPYDTQIATSHQYTGNMIHGGVDAVVRQPHWRVMLELAGRRDGDAADLNMDGSKATGHQYGLIGNLMFGFTPHGTYAPASKMAFLKKGYEIIGRVYGDYIHQPDNEDPGLGGNIRFFGIDGGVTWQLHKQLRMQADASYQWYSGYAYANNAGAQRLWAELWAVWRT
jgi:hypothetical protein